MEIPKNWTFKSNEVADNFDNHVREQLPWYDLATNAVCHIARHYLPQNGTMYDIGASTGNIGHSLYDTIKSRNVSLIGIDNSPQMEKHYRAPGELHIADAEDYDFGNFDVAVAFLVLMFIEPSKRSTWLKNLITKIKPGGVIIVFDKIETGRGYLSTVLRRLTISGKVSTGVDSQSIIDKELSLSGVQRPLPNHFMQFAFCEAVEVFRFGEFAGWVIERPEL